MPDEEKETQVDMYTNYKVFRTAQCCEPYSLKKIKSSFWCSLTYCISPVKGYVEVTGTGKQMIAILILLLWYLKNQNSASENHSK